MTSVHVWLATVKEDADCRALERILSPAERGRAARFVRRIDRIAYAAAHALLRQALSTLDNTASPDAWTFDAEPSGRPFLTGPNAGLEFSLTHSTALVGCAVTTGARVGIDVEATNREAPVAVGVKYFGPNERAMLDAAGDVERRELFLRYWTLKEAYLKARGVGVAPSRLSKVTFGSDVLRQPQPVFADEWDDDPSRWSFAAWIAHDCHVALAVQAPDSTTQVIPHTLE